MFSCSVSDPLHFDPDPDPQIRFKDKGSGSEQIPIFFFLIFFCKRYKTHNDVFVVVVILSLLIA